MIIDLPRFVATERPSWAELEAILKRLEGSADHRMDFEEAKRFHFLYQKVSADLGRTATFASEPDLCRYLESLVGRAYGEIHETRRRGWRWRPLHWFLRQFPRTFRRNGWAFSLSVWVTIAGMVFGGLAVALDDEAKNALLPGGFSHLSGSPAERVAREERAKIDRLKDAHASFASQLMTHNINVSIEAMALGMIWGIGTIIILFYNGVMLGLIAVDYVLGGQTVFMLGWLLPHGVIEIPAILIGGQAGLLLGRAVIGHGDRAMLAERLRAISGDVATLIGGVAVMLVWAGIVESFLSQHHQPVVPYWLKIAFGVAEFIGLVWFLRRGGLAPDQPRGAVRLQKGLTTP